MPKSALSRQERLQKLKISEERFLQEANTLQNLGFKIEEAEKLILRKSSKNTVDAVIQLTPILLKAPYDFELHQIIKISLHDGGSQNLEKIKDAYQKFINWGFSKNEIVRMVGHGGGSYNLQAVEKNHNILLNLKFSLQDIVRMVSHDGGSHNLNAIKDNYQTLTALGFKNDDIVRLVSHDGGSQNLNAINHAYQALTVLGLSKDEIVSMVSHSGGANNLNVIKDAYSALTNLGFSKNEIVRMVSHSGGANKLNTIKDAYAALINLGFTRDEMVCMVSHDGGSQNLNAIKDNYLALIDLGFNRDEIVRMVSKRGGSQNLNAVKDNYLALIDLGFTRDEIVCIASRVDGSKKIDLLVILSRYPKFKVLLREHSNDIFCILKRRSGYSLMSKLLNYHQQLLAYGFSFKNVLSLFDASDSNAQLLVSFITKLKDIHHQELMHRAKQPNFKTWLQEQLCQQDLLWNDEELQFVRSILFSDEQSMDVSDNHDDINLEILTILQSINEEAESMDVSDNHDDANLEIPTNLESINEEEKDSFGDFDASMTILLQFLAEHHECNAPIIEVSLANTRLSHLDYVV